MRTPLALCLVALLVAGCTGGEGGAPTPAPSDGPRYDVVTLLGRGGPEPVVRVADDGAIYVAAQDSAAGTPHFWASTDGARSFRQTTPSQQSGGEVDMAPGPGGSVYVTQLGPNGNVISISRDRGETWSSSAFGLLTQYFDREWVAVDARGSVYVIARQFGTETAAAVSRSDDGGITFLRQGNAWDAANEPGLANGNLIAYEGGVAVVYVCRDNRGVCVSTSTDRGATWTQSLVSQRPVELDAVYPVIAADGRRLVVTWSEASGSSIGVFVASSGDGRSWSAPQRVSLATESATLPWIASRAGATWLTYLTTDKLIATSDGDAAASVDWRVVVLRVDAGSLAAADRAVALDTPVHRGVISKPVGRGGQSGPFDRSFGDFYTIEVDRSGRAIVAVVKTVGGAAQDLLLMQAR